MSMRSTAAIVGLALGFGIAADPTFASTYKFDYEAEAGTTPSTFFGVPIGQRKIDGQFTTQGSEVVSLTAFIDGVAIDQFLGAQYNMTAPNVGRFSFGVRLDGFEYILRDNLGLSPINTEIFVNGVPSSFGTTTISAVPLPASAAMFGAALLAVGAVGFGVKRKKAAAAA